MTKESQPLLPVHDREHRLSQDALDVLGGLKAGVLVVDGSLAIRSRNEKAAMWLAEACDLDTAFAAANFFGPFEDWTTEIRRVLESGVTARFDCALPGKDVASPLLLSICCTRIETPASDGDAKVALLLVERPSHGEFDERHETARRLASLGKLTTRVAHELNNPLDGILRYINLAIRMTNDASEPKLKTYLLESRTGLMRMVQIVGDLLEFSRATGGEFVEVGIDEVIDEAIRATAPIAEENSVVVTADFQTQKLPSVRGNRLYQVCCNVIRNAIDAMPKGGRLSIACGIVGDEAVIRICDTGVGLPEPPEKVFEPFFTTKAPGKGTGLGLAICRDFIEDMQGKITAAPGEGGGAVFTIRIPAQNTGRRPPTSKNVATAAITTAPTASAGEERL